jgi:hypothetical protein
MSFDDVNNDIRNGGGSYLALNQEGQSASGVVLDVKKRKMVFNDKVVENKNGEPRYEWVFTFDIDGETKKWAAKERGQIAVREALRAAGVDKLEPNSRLHIKVTKSSVQGKSQAEYEIKYEAPKFGSLPQDDDTPF